MGFLKMMAQLVEVVRGSARRHLADFRRFGLDAVQGIGVGLEPALDVHRHVEKSLDGRDDFERPYSSS